MIRRFARRSLVCLMLLALCASLTPGARGKPAKDKAAADAPPAGAYQVDPDHTNLYFKIKHMGISYVYGRFDEVKGTLTLGDKPSFEVDIPAASIDTHVKRRDDDLRSKRFFHVKKYPTLKFQSTRVKVDGDTYTVTGDFTLHGQTHQITIPFTYLGVTTMHGRQRVGFAGKLTIDRTKWGMNTMVGMVGKDVHLMLSFEAAQKAQKAQK